jgi:hypothetical protein
LKEIPQAGHVTGFFPGEKQTDHPAATSEILPNAGKQADIFASAPS